jgi:hypothetical protein
MLHHAQDQLMGHQHASPVSELCLLEIEAFCVAVRNALRLHFVSVLVPIIIGYFW